MGYLFRGTCYPTQDTARAAECSSRDVTAISGADVHTAQCATSDFTGSTYTLCARVNGGACTSIVMPAQADIPCAFDPVELNTDLGVLFGLALGAAVSVLGAKWVYEYFRPDRNHES